MMFSWAASEERDHLIHDVGTITGCAYKRVERGKRMPGVFEVRRSEAVRVSIEDVLLLAECSIPGEWERQVRYLPLK